jgi:hypothetical protein
MCKAFISILICCFLLYNLSVSGFQSKYNLLEKPVIDAAKRKKNALNGPSIQVSPGFAYYENRSKESLADEIVLAGYKTVHYFVTNENFVDKELIKAFQNRNIAVWAMVLSNGTYSTKAFPKDWKDWKVKFIGPYNFEGFTFLSPFSGAYLNWKKDSLRRLLMETPFDGIEFAESYLPGSWEESTKASHGDVSTNARIVFKEKYNRNIPEFFDVNAPEYYKSDVALYKLWIDFRVDGVNNFLNELINGKGGVRTVRPDILVATWSLGIDAGPNSVELLRTHNGLDVPEMVKLVKPDIHFIQTHYPDWIKPEAELPATYFKAYSPFFEEIHNVNKKLPIGLQADIGSVKSMIKSGAWLKQFFAEAAKSGYSTAMAYEYQLGGYIYTDKPVLLRATRKNENNLQLVFNKRVDEKSAAVRANYTFISKGKTLQVNIHKIETDGNCVILTTDRLPARMFELEVKEIQDTPELWFYKGYPANHLKRQRIKIKLL